MPVRPALGLRVVLAFPLVLSLLCLTGAPSRAQHPGLPQEASLDERLREATRIGWVRVVGSTPGRLEVALERALLGALPERFEVKRAPSNPPPLATGSHAVLLLRGERSPYVLAEAPSRVLEVAPDDAPALADAIAAALAAGSDPAALATLYGGWIPSADARLRDFAATGLERLIGDGSGDGDDALRRRIALAQAGIATDAGQRIESRRAAALLALRHLDGAARLVAGLAAERELADPSLFRLGLQAGTSVGTPELGVLYDAAVRHEDPQVRRVAMRLARAVASVVGDEALAAAERLAADDPVAAVRRQAERALRQPAARPQPDLQDG